MCVTGWSLAPVAGTKDTGTLSSPHFTIAPLRLYSCLLLHLCWSWWTRRTLFRAPFPCLVLSWGIEFEVGDHDSWCTRLSTSMRKASRHSSGSVSWSGDYCGLYMYAPDVHRRYTLRAEAQVPGLVESRSRDGKQATEKLTVSCVPTSSQTRDQCPFWVFQEGQSRVGASTGKGEQFLEPGELASEEATLLSTTNKPGGAARHQPGTGSSLDSEE